MRLLISLFRVKKRKKIENSGPRMNILKYLRLSYLYCSGLKSLYHFAAANGNYRMWILKSTLRSTLYGNFIRKLHRSAGHDVHSINYVGDWGTQFSILAVYWELVRDVRPSQLQWDQWNARQRVEFLTQFYADANRHVKSNDHLLKRASEIFSMMEATVMRDQQMSAHGEAERLTANRSGSSSANNVVVDVSDGRWNGWNFGKYSKFFI